jgi:hypothetical protein
MVRPVIWYVWLWGCDHTVIPLYFVDLLIYCLKNWSIMWWFIAITLSLDYGYSLLWRGDITLFTIPIFNVFLLGENLMSGTSWSFEKLTYCNILFSFTYLGETWRAASVYPKCYFRTKEECWHCEVSIYVLTSCQTLMILLIVYIFWIFYML